MSLSFQPLTSDIGHLDALFDDIERAWEKLGRPGSLRPHLKSKREDLVAGKMDGLIGLDDGQPAAVGWTDLPHGNYGTVVLHAVSPDDEVALGEGVVKAGLLNGRVLELVHFRTPDNYRHVFGKNGLKEHFRQKMAIGLAQIPPAPSLPEEVKIEQLEAEHADAAGEISHAAHATSKDLKGYPDFETPQRRADLERKIFSGLFGPVIRPASLLVRYRDEPAGSCLVVGLPGWGYDQVAWVLDMTIKPGLHGLGLGQAMLHASLRGIVEAGLPVAGLAVTKSNGHAVRLYEKTGFQVVDEFYEYVGPG